MRVGGPREGRSQGQPWCPQPRALPESRVSYLLRAHAWIVKPRRAHAPGSVPGTFSIPSASELPHLALGAKLKPVAGWSSPPVRGGSRGAVRGAGSRLGAARGHSGISVLCSAAAVAVWYQRCEDTWARGGPLLLGRAFCFFPPFFFLPFRFSFSTSFGFETLVIFKETMVLLTPPWCSRCPCF